MLNCIRNSKIALDFSLDLRIFHAERFKVKCCFNTLKNYFKINRINSSFGYC